MAQPTFCAPDLDAFCMLNNSGVTVTGQHLTAESAALECRMVEADQFCRQCGAQARVRQCGAQARVRQCGAQARVQGSVVRKVTHVPMGWRPTQLHLRLRRYRCDDCALVWQQDTTSVVPQKPNSRMRQRCGR